MPENNVLDPSAILHSTSQIASSFQTPYDAIAAAAHAIMLGVGFRFAGLGDDARQEGDGTQRTLPEGWNSNGPHSYNFRYSHPQSCLTFVIKVVRLGDKCIILGIGIGDNKTAMLDILLEDYTSASYFPCETLSDRPLVHGFISSNRFEDFIKAYKLNIIQRLMPGLNKPGYEDNSSSSITAGSSNRRPTPAPLPTFPDQGQAPRRDPRSFDPAFPDVGGSDLNPLRGPGGLPLPGGDGMYVGPDHPFFRGGVGRSDDPSDLFGGPQPLPRGSVPPGARFDPIGPFGRLPGGPHGQGSAGRGLQGPRGPHSGEPDNDELQPPGYNDMFG